MFPIPVRGASISLTERHQHPEQKAEQAYIDRAYERLSEMRAEADRRAQAVYDIGRGGTPQSRYERDVTVAVSLERARHLDIGGESLIFGRIDHTAGECYYVGRRAVFSVEREPLVIDWRVPAAEPFYRATGKHPLGLARRRHFLSEGRRLLQVEDERFSADLDAGELGLAGMGALVAALERPRTGQMRDIVATIQSEQDEIIRDDLEGVLAVQGGPGTGKTAVALHRAAYLLYTHRRKLGQQGILVVGPNRTFLRYIEQVLPALGETGARLVTLSDLVPGAEVTATEADDVARVKGDTRMVKVIARAVRERQRPLQRDVVVPFDGFELTLRARETESLVAAARRNRRPHNQRREMMISIIAARLYDEYRQQTKTTMRELASIGTRSRREAMSELKRLPELMAVVDEMWPLLSPQRLLRELFADAKLLNAATAGILRPAERDLLRRDGKKASWTVADSPLLDEAFVRLGRPGRRARTDDPDETDERETYGHVVVDEVQDLPPMALRMLARRSRAGSMTIVGDLAQAVGAWTPRNWDAILRHLPERKARVRELTINYRTPAEIMDVAGALLVAAAPDVEPPSSVRETGEPPVVRRADDAIGAAVEVARTHTQRGSGTMVAIAPETLMGDLRRALGAAGLLEHTDATDPTDRVSVMNVAEAKGLEFDAVIVVEPGVLVASSPQGLRALYVAMTRATQHVTLVHAGPLPSALTDALALRVSA